MRRSQMSRLSTLSMVTAVKGKHVRCVSCRCHLHPADQQRHHLRAVADPSAASTMPLGALLRRHLLQLRVQRLRFFGQLRNFLRQQLLQVLRR